MRLFNIIDITRTCVSLVINSLRDKESYPQAFGLISGASNSLVVDNFGAE